MAKRGKNINVFLMDGEANGRIKATISNWVGVVYKIPRNRLAICKERDDLAQSSVYFLFGHSHTCGREVVYIGQAGIRKAGGGILVRLMEHDKNPEKDYWTEAVVFTTSNNSFGPTELSFLENRFCNMAVEANRYVVKNGNDPTPGNITEEKESELDEFSDYAELILGVLGYKVFQPLEDTNEAPPPKGGQEPHKFPVSTPSVIIPPLPNSNLKIGMYVRTAMSQLSESGYYFSEDLIDEMCTPEWSKLHFRTNKPFMKRYIPGKTDNLGSDGRVRFWSTPFNFKGCLVLITKEWYERQHECFDVWYKTL